MGHPCAGRWRRIVAMLVAVLIAFVGIFGITALDYAGRTGFGVLSMLFSLPDRWLIGRGLLPGK